MKKAMTLVLAFALLLPLFTAFASAADAPVNPTAAPTAKPNGPYTLEEARLLITDRIPGGEIVYYREDYDDRYLVYEGQVTDGEYVYKFEIDPQTGRFLEWDMDRIRRSAEATNAPSAAEAGNTAEASGLIGTARAREIALSQAGEGATIQRIKLERENGRQVYEGKGYEGWFEFEFEIDAMTGAILDWEWDD